MTEHRGIKPQKWKSKHPVHYYRKYQIRARERDPDFVYYLIRRLAWRWMKYVVRLEVSGLENIPEEGAILVVPNHFSFADHFMVGIFFRRAIRFMAKAALFDNKFAGAFFSHGGVFPVARGERDDEAFETAHRLLQNRWAIVMYLQGGRTRSEELIELEGPIYPGVGKLRHMTGVSVLPVAVSGTQFFRFWKSVLLQRQLPFVVKVSFGPVMPSQRRPDATRDDDQRASEEVFEVIKQLYEPIKPDWAPGLGF